MRCPSCDHLESRVIDSRPADQHTSIRRRRVCEACDFRYTTYERIVHSVLVRKRDGATEAFQAEKIRRGLLAAMADRADAEETIEAIVDEVEAAARGSAVPMPTDEVGALILDRLRAFDEVAYLRFASVYKDFEVTEDFERELAQMEAPPIDTSMETEPIEAGQPETGRRP